MLMAALAFNGQESHIAFSGELQNFELRKGSGFISESRTDGREPLKLNDPQSKGSSCIQHPKTWCKLHPLYFESYHSHCLIIPHHISPL